MAHYAPEFLAAVRHRYEKTDQPMIEMAREFGLGMTTLQVMVDKQGWEKRSQRLRGLPPALRLEKEAEALAAIGTLPAPTRSLSGEASEAAVGNDDPHGLAASKALPTPDPSPPLVARADGGEPSAVPRGAEPSPIERLERLVVQEIADLESARDLRGGKRVSGAGAERAAQALASLTRTLQTIRTMRGGPEAPGDQPVDIDERRRRLAERIRAFVRSRRAEEAGDTASVEAG
jgi:hypothetical protein